MTFLKLTSCGDTGRGWIPLHRQGGHPARGFRLASSGLCGVLGGPPPLAPPPSSCPLQDINPALARPSAELLGGSPGDRGTGGGAIAAAVGFLGILQKPLIRPLRLVGCHYERSRPYSGQLPRVSKGSRFGYLPASTGGANHQSELLDTLGGVSPAPRLVLRGANHQVSAFAQNQKSHGFQRLDGFTTGRPKSTSAKSRLPRIVIDLIDKATGNPVKTQPAKIQGPRLGKRLWSKGGL